MANLAAVYIVQKLDYSVKNEAGLVMLRNKNAFLFPRHNCTKILPLVTRKIDTLASSAKISNRHVNASGSARGGKSSGSNDADAIQ